MKKRKGRPFLEIFASALNEDYRFPILEIFAFLYALGTFVFASFVSVSVSGESIAYMVTSSLMTVPLLIFVILIFKNIAYGLGNDIEKGVIQTYFSYPLKRRWILSAKLLSALGVALLLFLTIQISALYVLAPDVVAPYLGTIILTIVAYLSFAFLLAGVILLVAIILKRGGLALVVGIVLYFAFSIIQSLVSFVAYATGSKTVLQIMSLFTPNLVVSMYYQPFTMFGNQLWSPTFTEVLSYVGASYVIVASVFILGYLYFSRRLNL